MTVAVLAALTAATSVHAQAATPAPPDTGWKSSAAAGLTLTRGNSSTLLATLGASTGKKWDANEISLGIDAAYGKSKDQATGVNSTTAGSLHAFMQYNRLFNERLYGYLRLEGLHDAVADINYRLTLSPGLGYYFIKQKKTDLSAEVGPGVVFERLNGNNQTYVTLRVGEKFHHELSDRARIWEMADIMPQVDKFSHYLINAELGIEADLTADKKLSLRAVLQDSYNSEPASGKYKNDAKIITAIAYKF